MRARYLQRDKKISQQGDGVSARRAVQLRDIDSVLTVEDLVVEFPAGPAERVHAVSDISFDLARGETLGLVGESGCGKSTTGKAVLCLPRPTGGSVHFEGVDLPKLRDEELRRTRTRMQIIFQDPISSLNPRRCIGDIITEPLAIWGGANDRGDRQARLEEMMEAVGLDYALQARRRPHEFSGGQCQRISIARALMLNPTMLICDEPVSSLDVSVQAQILNLLEDMKTRYGLTMIFISHDLSVIRNISDRVAVMYLGKLCEVGRRDAVYEQPLHPYTSALLAAIPEVGPRSAKPPPPIAGELPSPINPPSGCRFHTRCPKADAVCVDEEPPMVSAGDDHYVACHHPNPVPVQLGRSRLDGDVQPSSTPSAPDTTMWRHDG
jgi:peptide/nickel transport system ATP-binding protein